MVTRTILSPVVSAAGYEYRECRLLSSLEALVFCRLWKPNSCYQLNIPLGRNGIEEANKCRDLVLGVRRLAPLIADKNPGEVVAAFSLLIPLIVDGRNMLW